MRYVYLALLIVLTSLVFLFKIQNLESVTVSFYSLSLTLPLSILILLVYVLGMLTGGFVVSHLRTWIQGASKRSKQVKFR